MSSITKHTRPYPEPEPRSFIQWCNDLGIACEGNCSDANKLLTFDEFISLPDVRLIKVRDTELYNWWRQYGDVWGEYRTVEEWLHDFHWQIEDPTEEDIKDLNLILGHDEFWQWSSGKVTEIPKERTSFLDRVRKLFRKKET